MTEIMQKFGIPRRFWEARFEDFRGYQAAAADAVKAAVSRGGSFMICGGTGRGKTRLLCAAAAELARLKPELFREDGQRIRGARYLYAPEVLMKIQDSYTGRESRESVYQQYTGLRVVFLDDFGADSATEDFRRHWGFIFNQWFERGAQVYLTSNLALESIGRQIDARIASRIDFMCEGRVFDVDGWARWRGE